MTGTSLITKLLTVFIFVASDAMILNGAAPEPHWLVMLPPVVLSVAGVVLVVAVVSVVEVVLVVAVVFPLVVTLSPSPSPGSGSPHPATDIKVSRLPNAKYEQNVF